MGSLLLALAVAAGAFGAHALASRLDEHQLEIWGKANFYQFVHSIGILVIALLGSGIIEAPFAAKICAIHLFGILVFCGSLYALALTDIKVLGAITPIGGAAFIVGWLLLAVRQLRG